MHRIAAACLASLLLLRLAWAQLLPLPETHLLWIPLPEDAAGKAAGPGGMPLLASLPAGWSAGDAAALLLAGEEDARMADRLQDSLLAEDTAVIRAPLHRPDAKRCHAGALHAIVAGVQALRRELDAGLVLAIGFGCGGRAARLAAAEFSETGLAAGIAIRPTEVAITPGVPPPREENWQHRAARLCALLVALHQAARADAALACAEALSIAAPAPMRHAP